MTKSSILDIDIGNTRVKWRLNASQLSEQSGAQLLHSGEGGFSLPLGDVRLDRIRIASVVKGAALDVVLDWCRHDQHLEPEIARVVENCAGVTQGYDDMSRLGVDRWLCLLAAYNQVNSACVVVSCGTAVTVDLVSLSGQHLGGYIVPGFELMRRSLFDGTNAVKVDAIDWPQAACPGRNTRAAVNNGVLLMVKGLVDQACDQLQKKGDLFALLLTGGDGEVFHSLFYRQSDLPKSCYCPTLVLDGLALALP